MGKIILILNLKKKISDVFTAMYESGHVSVLLFLLFGFFSVVYFFFCFGFFWLFFSFLSFSCIFFLRFPLKSLILLLRTKLNPTK